MALQNIIQQSNKYKELDGDAIKEEVEKNLDEYRKVIAY
jgi:hypothetical protein